MFVKIAVISQALFLVGTDGLRLVDSGRTPSPRTVPLMSSTAGEQLALMNRLQHYVESPALEYLYLIKAKIKNAKKTGEKDKEKKQKPKKKENQGSNGSDEQLQPKQKKAKASNVLQEIEEALNLKAQSYYRKIKEASDEATPYVEVSIPLPTSSSDSSQALRIPYRQNYKTKVEIVDPKRVSSAYGASDDGNSSADGSEILAPAARAPHHPTVLPEVRAPYGPEAREWLAKNSLFDTEVQQKRRPDQSHTANPIIFNENGEILLKVSASDGFSFGRPGGKFETVITKDGEKKEVPHVALERELSEETGLDFDSLSDSDQEPIAEPNGAKGTNDFYERFDTQRCVEAVPTTVYCAIKAQIRMLGETRVATATDHVEVAASKLLMWKKRDGDVFAEGKRKLATFMFVSIDEDFVNYLESALDATTQVVMKQLKHQLQESGSAEANDVSGVDKDSFEFLTEPSLVKAIIRFAAK